MKALASASVLKGRDAEAALLIAPTEPGVVPNPWQVAVASALLDKTLARNAEAEGKPRRSLGLLADEHHTD